MTAALFLELLAKSGLIAGLGLVVATVLHFRPAADRVDVLRATVCLLILLPLIMVLAPGPSLAVLPPVEAAALDIVATPIVWSGAVEPVEGVALS